MSKKTILLLAILTYFAGSGATGSFMWLYAMAAVAERGTFVWSMGHVAFCVVFGAGMMVWIGATLVRRINDEITDSNISGYSEAWNAVRKMIDEYDKEAKPDEEV